MALSNLCVAVTVQVCVEVCSKPAESSAEFEALECPLPLPALQTSRAEGCALGWQFEVTPLV